MQATRVALLQYALVGDHAAMCQQVEALTAQAKDGGAAFVCLPEFSLIPYFPGTTDPQGFHYAEDPTDGPSVRFFAETAHRYSVYLLGSFYEKTAEGGLFDTATLHAPDGSLVGMTRKVHIPSGEGYNETHFFSGYHAFPVHETEALKCALPTCYDQWFPELARIYAMNGAEFIFYPTAIGSDLMLPEFEYESAWTTVMRGHAAANGVFIGAANRVGVENGVIFFGSSFVCDPRGEILAQAGRDTTEVIFADLDPQVMANYRFLFPLLHQRRPELYARLLENDAPYERPAWVRDSSGLKAEG
jgi:N-carbamoylputrescine amidase